MSALSESPPVVDANGCEVVSGPIENRIVEPHEVHPGLPNGTRVRHPSGKLVPLGERFQTRDPVEVGRKGGRPKGLARRIREMVGDDPGRIANILFDILEDPTARDNDRIAAAKELFDRGWGKAPTFMPIREMGGRWRSRKGDFLNDCGSRETADGTHSSVAHAAARRRKLLLSSAFPLTTRR